MKKAMSLILALVLCIGFCACGNSKYAGTYVGRWSWSFGHIISPQPEKYMDSYSVNKDGEFTYVLNSDGTGRMTFVADKLYDETNVTMIDCPITWEVVDDCIYISGSCESIYDVSKETIEIDQRFVIDGKDLWNGHEYGSRFRKQ